MLPGNFLHRIAKRSCSTTTCERVIEPLIADLQREWLSADRPARRLRGRRIASTDGAGRQPDGHDHRGGAAACSRTCRPARLGLAVAVPGLARRASELARAYFDARVILPRLLETACA